MSPIKAMPLLLAVLTPFVMTAGVAAAAEAPIIFAQFNPKDKDEHKQRTSNSHSRSRPSLRLHSRIRQHRRSIFSRPRRSSSTKAASTPVAPGETQPQMHTTQGVSPDAVKPRNQGSTQPQMRTQGSTQPQVHTTQGVSPDAVKPRSQGDTQPQPRTQGSTQPALHTAPDAAKLHGQGSAQPAHSFGVTPDAGKAHTGAVPDAAKLHNQGGTQPAHSFDPVKAHPQQPQLQQAHRQDILPRHELSAEEKHAKAERDAHAAGRATLIEKQKLMAAHEKSPAAINERLKIQNERLHVIASQRQESKDAHGQLVIKEPGNRTILQVNGHAFIQHDETAHFRAFGGIPQTRRGANGNAISTIVRPDGVRIEVEVDGYGRPLRRVRYLPDGRRFVLFENRALAIGAGLALGALIVSLPPVEVDIPREEYIVDANSASEDDIYGALQAGPVVALDRSYSLEEVLASVRLRERMRSVNINSINFDFGSADVPQDQAEMLESVAAAMRDMTSQNPGEVFLVEGHTDAVGSDVDNLSLSDRRAEAIADVLSQQFNIPRENLVTQGYGKQFLLVDTPEPERRNRRVVIRRITPLIQAEDGQYSEGGSRD